jgi:uncharacterized protein YaiI (UPF0178 family)
VAGKIWVDADACPVTIKEVLYRAAQKRQVRVTFVANQGLRLPASEFLQSILVTTGLNVADQKIVSLVRPGDLVVTADIPLAADIVAKNATGLSPRGELFTVENIGERVAVRNLLDDLRGEGQITGGPSGISAQDKQAFANQLDRWLTRSQTAKDL